jgi:hypothetical protein
MFAAPATPNPPAATNEPVVVDDDAVVFVVFRIPAVVTILDPALRVRSVAVSDVIPLMPVSVWAADARFRAILVVPI